MSNKGQSPEKTADTGYLACFLSSVSWCQQNSGYILIFAAAVLTVYLLIRPRLAVDYQLIQVGHPSPQTVFAPFDFEFVDQAATEQKKKETESKINPVYNSHPVNADLFLSRLSALAHAVQTTEKPPEQSLEAWAQLILSKSDFTLQNQTYEPDPAARLPGSTFESLYAFRHLQPFWQTLETHIQSAMGQGIADNVTPLREVLPDNTSDDPQTVVIQIISPEGVERALFAGREIFTFDEFLQRLDKQLQQTFSDSENLQSLKPFTRDILSAAYAGPSFTYNKEETEKRRSESHSRVNPVVKRITKGEIIVGYSETVTPEQMQVIHALISHLGISVSGEIGYTILAFFFVLSVWVYIYLFHFEAAFKVKALCVIFFTILTQFVFARICTYFSLLELGTYRFDHAEFGVPVGMLGVILTILFEPRLAVFCCAMTAVYMGLIFGQTAFGLAMIPVVVTITTSLCAVYTISRIRQRSDLYRAGGIVILTASVLIITNVLFEVDELQDITAIADSLKWALIWGTVNGCLVSILSISLLPIFEDLLGITTDIKLLELSQRNELLQRLEDEAPGSYQHTMRVATLAESAAEEIGANALLTRVGTYYHDIGKMVKPLYFVENQQTKADRAKHSKISMNMSCMIIRNHVKHGLEIGKQYKLPKVILDFIPEHHGTTLLTYFYHKVLEELEKEGKEITVKEEDFRYPGPKPQSKETAIVMLSDALEASSRTLEQTTERDIRQLVRKIINDRFMDGQFDECNLTLRDLHLLYHSFSGSLLHTMHQRIAYPGKPSGLKPGQGKENADEPEIAQSETNDTMENTNPEPEVKPVAIKQK